MIDCYMSLTLPYAIELARRCEPYNVKWIEETLPPDDYEGYAELKKAVKTTLITTGEHEYTRKSCNYFPVPFQLCRNKFTLRLLLDRLWIQDASRKEVC